MLINARLLKHAGVFYDAISYATYKKTPQVNVVQLGLHKAV